MRSISVFIGLWLIGLADQSAMAEANRSQKEPFYLEIASGRAHSCALKRTGSIYCWGDNSSGQLGVGIEFKGFARPAEVLSTSSFKKLAVGDDHACAVTEQSTVECWGAGTFGQNGQLRVLDIPTKIEGLQRIEKIAAGARHTCAIDDEMVAYCWGAGDYGQLGAGRILEKTATPMEVDFDERIAEISAGGDHTCFLDLAGMLFCFGRGEMGQLGNGSTESSTVPVPVNATENQFYAQVAAGRDFTCALEASGVVWCFGRGDVGQLGTGASVNRLEPQRVAGGIEFAHLSAGTDHTCATTKDQQAFCWGKNSYSKLGADEEISQALEPILVTSKAKFTAASTGHDHTCFLAYGVGNDSNLYCHGHGGSGRLGSGTTENIDFPNPIFRFRQSAATGVYKRCSSRVTEEGQVDIFGLVMAMRGKKSCLEFAKESDQITELDLSAKNIVDVSDVGYFIKLIKLDLRKNKISQLAGLVPLKSLQELRLDHNQIKRIKPLGRISTFKKVTLSHNRLNNVDVLGKSKGLEYLDAGNNRIMFLTSFAQFKNLRYLDLSHNDFAYVGGLRKLELDTFIVSGNNFQQIIDPQYLKSIKISTTFIANGCWIRDLSFMNENKSEIKNLSLYNNSIVDITTLKNYENIEILNLNRNDIKKEQKTCPKDAKSEAVRNFCVAF